MQLTRMTDSQTDKAWAAVHANTPEGWFVGQPGYEERYRQWSMHAFDPARKPWLVVVSVSGRPWAGPRWSA